ncbi:MULTISPECIES: non-hydrolyzing UDP-N-acetylglucosamine 2-epimerase [Streptomycetaceae]|uniref:UDP-N-acetylglucosamine 2-epimerase (non-hydrolyzing) n=1 Tax=Streptantibioticus cattleyicolor (strain ATCC 35852 / DSM 46488 / JCM 4925 / NBRC 14057 / NRRL 8057) TaxID=1003195 RepID=F8JV06_STREN|nr:MULTISPECIES: UDP-N-acetylglucosamine 2-epimerase (non-hydrolyzing) [Streptomycetaceae]AEW98175.1 UDP-N-acetylglucosamine 2-epimerase [Streptantibioticus cattleyicolor NRRL 8057 = DSM 46488]MYS62559.1 UDP-N-acetylglucosamine 2-epimerase (non-hydrolyzing) [Streptomyces sp. SID5468]CCB78490.1 putative UDP-N-acetylglucosamine 2-epimerase [Streptantibioticus cattleyicolor NRRL 8057 = DSM 46488]
MRSVTVVLGTRPEAIKFAPVIRALADDPRFTPVVVSTGQHRQMLDDTLRAFGLQPDVDLGVMAPRQTLSQVTYRSLRGLEKHLAGHPTDAVLVHGDTATTLAGALAGFHHRIPVVHVEAGLRSGHLGSPFPEEGNRRLVAQVAALHLAPTPGNKANLLREGIAEDTIVVTGNTVIDALRWAGGRSPDFGDPALDDLDDDPRRIVLASAHRREAWPHLTDIARALHLIASEPGVRVVVPLHRNPVVREAMLPVISGHPDITVVDPLPYLAFCRLMARADMIVSDSSGSQEEGPALGKPTLVIGDVTERGEAVTAGTARLVGKTTDGIAGAALELLRDSDAYLRMANAANPYGDGRATARTVAALAHFFGDGPAVAEFTPAAPARTAAYA